MRTLLSNLPSLRFFAVFLFIAVTGYQGFAQSHSNPYERINQLKKFSAPGEWGQTSGAEKKDHIYLVSDTITQTANGNPEESLFQQWDEDGTEWANSHIIAFTYNGNGQILTSRTMNYDPDAEDFINSMHTENEYDNDGNLIESLNQIHEDGTWVNLTRREMEYDGQGRQVNELTQNWDHDEEQWVNYSNNVSEYDERGTMVESRQEVWADHEWIMESGERIDPEYENDVLAGATVENWAFDDWENSYRFTTEQAGDGSWEQYTEQAWTGNDWENDFRLAELEWHDFNLFLIGGYMEQLWEDDWENYERVSAEYTGFNEFELIIFETWIDDDEEWENEFRIRNMYDDQENLTEALNEIWQPDEWFVIAGNQFILTYNGNNNVIEEIRQSWDQNEGGWLNVMRILNSYNGPVSAEEEYSVPAQFVLNQNYPNPFNPVTEISFEVPVSASVTLSVYDILGRRVSVLLNDEHFDPGNHTVSFNGSGLAGGVYLYQLRSGGLVKVRKMILNK